MRIIIALLTYFSISLIGCGRESSLRKELGATVSGNEIGFATGIAESPSGKGWGAPKSADDMVNDFMIIGGPDVPRVCWASFPPGWPSTVLIEVCGHDSIGRICDYIYPVGPLVSGGIPFWDITSIKKIGSGSPTGMASVGPGSALGVPALRQRADKISFAIAHQFASDDEEWVPSTVIQAGGDPALQLKRLAPDGTRDYELYVTLTIP